MYVILIVVVAIIAYPFVLMGIWANKRNNLLIVVRNLINDGLHEHYISVSGDTAIAYNQATRSLSVITKEKGKVELNSSDIISFEILEDGQLGTKIKDSYKIGLFTDTVKTVVSDNGKIKRLYLKLKVKNSTTPIVQVDFMRNVTYIPKDNPFYVFNNPYKKAVEEITHWHDLITILTHKG